MLNQQRKAAPAPSAKAKAKSKARATPKARAMSAHPPGGGPSASGGKGTGKAAQKTPDLRRVCYWHNHDGCSHGANCRFEHTLVKKELRDQIQRPSGKGRSASGVRDSSTGRSQSPGGEKKGKGKGRGKGKGKSKKSNLTCVFHTQGICTKGENCRFRHANKDEVDQFQGATAEP